MKYRIKKITYKNKKVVYYVHVKWLIFWLGIDFEGGADIINEGICYSRNDALTYINNHYFDTYKVDDIEIEYIIK